MITKNAEKLVSSVKKIYIIIIYKIQYLFEYPKNTNVALWIVNVSPPKKILVK